MKTNPQHTPSDHSTRLDLWLKEATRGLCEEAAARVGREIAEHFDASVCARLDQGAPRHEAETAALAALGSARVARRKLCKANLTKKDVMLLARVTGTPVGALRFRRTICVLYAFFIIGSFAALPIYISSLSNSHLVDISVWCMALSMNAVYAAHTLGPLIYATAPERGLRNALHRVFRIQCLIAGVIAMLALVQIPTIPASAVRDWHGFVIYYFVPPVYAIMALYSAILGSLRIARKLPHASKPVAP